MQCIKHSLKAKSSNSDRQIYHCLSCDLKKQLPSPQKTKIKLKKRKETTSFDTSFNRYKKKIKKQKPSNLICGD